MSTNSFIVHACWPILMLVPQLCLAQAPQESAESKTGEIARALANAHKVWGPKLNSPECSITLKELSRSAGVVKYRLYATGFSRTAKYSLISWPVTEVSPREILSGVTVDETGLAICSGAADSCGSPEKPDDPIDLEFRPARGEPLRVALASNDKNLKAFAKIVPIPIEARNRQCHAQAVILLRAAALVAIEGDGFKPNSSITIDSNSEGESHNGHGKAEGDGTYFSAILPAVKGKTHGTTHVKIKTDECRMELSFDWGSSIRD